MFAHIPPEMLAIKSLKAAEEEIALVKENLKNEVAEKTPGRTVVGDGSTGFSIFVFTMDSTQPHGYKIECNNLRDQKYNQAIKVLPPGFYCLVQSKAGNFFAMRTGLNASAHPKILTNAGLDNAQSNVSAAGEIFVGSKGRILLFNPSSGGYHPATTATYLLDKKIDAAMQLSAMGLPVAAILSDYKIFTSLQMQEILKKFFSSNGKWQEDLTLISSQEKDNTLKSDLTQDAKGIFFSKKFNTGLNAIEKIFLNTVITCYQGMQPSISAEVIQIGSLNSGAETGKIIPNDKYVSPLFAVVPAPTIQTGPEIAPSTTTSANKPKP